MTQWVENPELGRDRGPAGLLRAWVEILVRPRQFFREKVAPGDQAPGLTFAAAVVLLTESVRIGLVGGAYPVVGGQPVASAVLWVLALTVLVTPAGIHLTAALQTVILIGAVENRAGVSETVQVICYALAPCFLVGLSNPWLTSLAVLWGGALFVLGIATVHDVSPAVAVPVTLVPAALVFGYGFGGDEALRVAGERLWDRLDTVLD